MKAAELLIAQVERNRVARYQYTWPKRNLLPNLQRRNKMKKASHKGSPHRTARRVSSHRAAQHSNEPLVAAAQSIGSTLGMMVAKVRDASELAIGSGKRTAKAASKVGARVRSKVKAKVSPRRKARKNSKAKK
jgi:hypothetical protein